MTSLELILPLTIVAIVFSGFMIRLFRNNWKAPFDKLSRRVDDLELKNTSSIENHSELKKSTTQELEKIFTEMTKIREELATGLKTLEKEYSEAIGDNEDKFYKRLDECTRQIEKLNDRFIELTRDIIQIASNPQNYRIQK